MTVAICTLNRAESLRRTLESLAAMRVPGDIEWELVVVNNNCTDDTDAVIEAFAGRLPVRREFEPERGVSLARNRAVDTADGDYLIWTDDDVVVDPDWLAAYAEAFRRWPGAAVFGGPIIPKYEAPVVSWVLTGGEALRAPFAICDSVDAPLPLSLDAGALRPPTANLALRSAEQRAFRYNPELGPGPGRRRLGEDADVVDRILRSGAVGYWVPEARVEHCIGRERQTIRYVANQFAAGGETDAFSMASKETVPLYFGAPRWLWRRLIEGWLRYHVHRLISPASVWMRHLRSYSYARGAIQYWRRRRV